MKILPIAISLPIAVGVGFALGWRCKTDSGARSPGAENTATSYRSDAHPASMTNGSATPAKNSSSGFIASEGSIEENFKSELRALKRLSDTEFANQMADVWFAREDPANLLSRALFAEACDGTKAGAFYDEFKRRKGISDQADAGPALWNLMFLAGKKNGAEVIQKLTESHPQGILELDTIVHGWVSAQPTEAVEWLNSLPDDCPFYSKSLKGIVWGIGEMSPAFAVDTFLKLPLEERNQKFESLAGGALNGHGIAGLNEIAARLPDESDRRNLLMSSLQFSLKLSPAEFVDGMAGQLSSVPDLSGSFQIMADRWVKLSPDDATAWFKKNADRVDQSPALRVMAERLSQTTHSDAAEAWLAAHPR